MRCLGFYWLELQFKIEELQERWAMYIIVFLLVILYGFTRALIDVLMGL